MAQPAGSRSCEASGQEEWKVWASEDEYSSDLGHHFGLHNCSQDICAPP